MTLENIILLILCFVGGWIGIFFLIPRIVGVAKYKHLMDNPTARSSHTNGTPRLGGIAFFINFVLCIYLLRNFLDSSEIMPIIAGMIIIFIIGIKDDLVIVSPITKLMGQVIAASFIFLDSNFRITDMHNCLTFSEVNPYIAIFLTAFFMLYIINAFNLIDGIDGLASSLAMIVFLFFGGVFFFIGDMFYLGLCLTGVGSLLSFLRFNIYDGKNKLFMGDTGSMILGFIVALLSVKVLSLDLGTLSQLPIRLENLPILILVALLIPLYDTARIFIVRVLKKRNPFSPDRKHIHHLLMDHFELSHKRVSFYLATSNFVLIVLFSFLSINLSEYMLLILVGLLVTLFTIFFYQIDPLYKRLKDRKAIQ